MITVRQIDKKQLYVIDADSVRLNDSTKLYISVYYSYRTPIAVYCSGMLLMTKEHFNNTTTKHKGIVKRKYPLAKLIEIEQDELEDIIEKTILIKPTILEAILRSQKVIK